MDAYSKWWDTSFFGRTGAPNRRVHRCIVARPADQRNSPCVQEVLSRLQDSFWDEGGLGIRLRCIQQAKQLALLSNDGNLDYARMRVCRSVALHHGWSQTIIPRRRLQAAPY